MDEPNKQNKQNKQNKYKQYKQYFIYFIGLCAGFMLAYMVNYKSQKKQALILQWNNKCYHIHHWITYSIIVLTILAAKHYSVSVDYAMIYFLVGLILEDFLYRNIFQLRTRCSL